jgi:hypothetical protein
MNAKAAALVLASLAVGCANAVAAGDTDPSLKMRNPRLEIRWASADLRPAPFGRVMLAPVELDFRPTEPMVGPRGTASASRTEFPVPERSRERMAKDFNEIFREELADNPNFALADQPGPGVLLVKPSLRDIVSRVPPEEPIGPSRVYVDTVGEATLVVEIAESVTGQLLGTASDRRTAEPAGSIGDFGAVRANAVGAGFEVRRLAHRWASSLEKRLEQIYVEVQAR